VYAVRESIGGAPVFDILDRQGVVAPVGKAPGQNGVTAQIHIVVGLQDLAGCVEQPDDAVEARSQRPRDHLEDHLLPRPGAELVGVNISRRAERADKRCRQRDGLRRAGSIGLPVGNFHE